MRVDEAYKRGLIQIGKRIETNASCRSIIEDGKIFTGVISRIVIGPDPYFGLLRDDGVTGSGPYNTWKIYCGNALAIIKFESAQVTITVSESITNRIAKCVHNDKIIFLKFRKKIGNKKAYTVGKEYTIDCVFKNEILLQI